jgi:Zn-dependent protease with chaperone function/Tfp pilus assembly protein PilE
MSLVYKHERPLFRIICTLSVLFWLVLVVGTAGIALIYGLLFGVAYLFAQSGFISFVRGTGVCISSDQLPELHERLQRCCRTLEVDPVPEAYVLNAHGILNALATRFLRRHYVVLFSDVIDALGKQPAALDFYIGHELGHIKRGHLRWAWFLAPARFLPVLGAAYSRAREYTCDLHGLACCEEPQYAAHGLAVLAAGERSWSRMDMRRFAMQSDASGGFWMSFHELISDYPWLTKRMKRIIAIASGREADFPSRHRLAWVIALFVPNVGGSAGGGAAAAMMMVAVVGVMAAIAIPNFLRFQSLAQMNQAQPVVAGVRDSAHQFILQTGRMPTSLTAIGLPEDLSNSAVASVLVNEQSFTVQLQPGLARLGTHVELTPYIEDGDLLWHCSGDLDEQLLQKACADGSGAAETAPAMQGTGSARPAEYDSGATYGGGFQPNATVCSSDFRETAEYESLDEDDREALRQICNAWKLEQLQSQMGGS